MLRCDVLYFVNCGEVFYIMHIIKDISCDIVCFSNKTVVGSHRMFYSALYHVCTVHLVAPALNKLKNHI